MGLCRNFSKLVLAAINVILWGVAIVLIFFAGWISREYLMYINELTPLINAAVFPVFSLLAAGILIFIFVAVGCIAILKENKCLLGLFFVFLLLIFLVVTGGFVTSLILKEQLDSSVYNRLKDGVDHYLKNNNAERIDFIQREFVCCGVRNYSDWLDSDWYNKSNPSVKYPPSCCQTGACTYQNPDLKLNEKGCYLEIKNVVFTHLVIIVSSGAGCSLFLMIGMICTCVLLCSRRRHTEISYIGLQDPYDAEDT